MNKCAKVITEEALALSASEREELSLVLAASLGKCEPDIAGLCDDELSDEAKVHLAAAWDKGVASGPGRHGSIEDVIAEARHRFAGRA